MTPILTQMAHLRKNRRHGPARSSVITDNGHLRQTGFELIAASSNALAGRCSVNDFDWNRKMESYLSLREAMGFSNHAVRLLLQDFVNYLDQHQLTPPIRAQWAVDWACEASAQRGISGKSIRLSAARGFLTHLKAAF